MARRRAAPYLRLMSGTTERVGGSGDRDLVTSLRAGDEQTFATLVDEWSGWMLRLAQEHVPTRGAAEDVVQETWLAVIKGLDGFRGDAALRTWVYRIVLNQAKRRGVRDRRTVPFASLAPDDSGPTVDPARFQGPEGEYPGHWQEVPEAWPEQVALSREVHDVVAEALATLPARQRVVVTLRDVEGHTADEVRALLGEMPDETLAAPARQRLLDEFTDRSRRTDPEAP